MDTNLVLPFLANALLIAMQTWALGGVRNKRGLFRQYTYLQNFLSLLASTFFVIAICRQIAWTSRSFCP